MRSEKAREIGKQVRVGEGFAPDEGENNLHREWFDQPENAYMFRPAFRKYIAKNFPKPAPALVAAAS